MRDTGSRSFVGRRHCPNLAVPNRWSLGRSDRFPVGQMDVKGGGVYVRHGSTSILCSQVPVFGSVRQWDYCAEPPVPKQSMCPAFCAVAELLQSWCEFRMVVMDLGGLTEPPPTSFSISVFWDAGFAVWSPAQSSSACRFRHVDAMRHPQCHNHLLPAKAEP